MQVKSKKYFENHIYKGCDNNQLIIRSQVVRHSQKDFWKIHENTHLCKNCSPFVEPSTPFQCLRLGSKNMNLSHLCNRGIVFLLFPSKTLFTKAEPRWKAKSYIFSEDKDKNICYTFFFSSTQHFPTQGLYIYNNHYRGRGGAVGTPQRRYM